jgi:hypothetical protein
VELDAVKMFISVVARQRIVSSIAAFREAGGSLLDPADLRIFTVTDGNMRQL